MADPTDPTDPPDFNPDPPPEECQAKPQEVQRKVAAREENDPAQSEWRIGEELHDAFSPEKEQMVPHPLDGLPVPANERSSHNLQLPPPFRYDTVVCVGDDRTYVELWSGEGEGDHRVKIHVSGKVAVVPREQFCVNGSERARREFPRKAVIQRWGRSYVVLQAAADLEEAALLLKSRAALEVDDEVLLPVRPRRPRCKHYGRQLFSVDNMADAKVQFSNCGHPARRSVGGAALALMDEAVYACDWREPHDPESTEKWLDKRDRARLDNADKVEMVPLFGMEDSR